jgi:hypothetical protein
MRFSMVLYFDCIPYAPGLFPASDFLSLLEVIRLQDLSLIFSLLWNSDTFHSNHLTGTLHLLPLH